MKRASKAPPLSRVPRDAIEELTKRLSPLLPPDAKAGRHEYFITEACTALNDYFETFKPLSDALKGRRRRLRALAVAGRRFKAAVDALDSDAKERIEVARCVMLRRSGVKPDDAAALGIAISKEIVAAARVSFTVAEIAEHLDRGRRPKANAINQLGRDLAEAYDRAFLVKPSSAGLGRFAQVLTAILDFARLPPVAQSRLRTIVAQSTLRGEAPLSGRRPRKDR